MRNSFIVFLLLPTALVFAEKLVDIDLSTPGKIRAVHVGITTGGNRALRNEKNLEFTASTDNGKQVIKFTFADGHRVTVKTDLKNDEISIKSKGKTKDSIAFSQEQREYLRDLAAALEKDEATDTDTIDTPGCQGARSAKVLSEWPDTLNIDFDFDVEKEKQRHKARAEALAKRNSGNGTPPDVPPVKKDRILKMQEPIAPSDRRNLAYTSICSSVNSFVEVTHDDWDYDRWDDRTTYYAYLSMHADGPCSDGTYFWTGSSWSCYEPDHDPNVEYAYGGCFGRCGAGCGSGTQFTWDCADHDSCVRFGHSLASFWCDDEFTFTIDDALSAPNCF